MRWRVGLPGWVLGALGLVVPAVQPIAAADSPVLMLLQYTINGKESTISVHAKAGTVDGPAGGKPQPKWTILPGDALKAPTAPSGHVVELFRGSEVERTLLCRVVVKYFPRRDGKWVPGFRLDEEPLVARVNNRWVPITTIRGVPTLIVLTSSTLPNAEGFYPSLEFGLSTGLASIDSWAVK